MQNEQKEQLLSNARGHVGEIRAAISAEVPKVTEQFHRYNRQGNDPVAQKLTVQFADRLDQLHHLFPSPYFVRCDVRSEKGVEHLYFGKHQFIERSIFSWTSPAARLRFSDLGSVEYEVHDGGRWSGILQRKDQFMISGGKIVFMTSESEEYPRTLVYQEQLSRRKTGFILPEIVERMERAQDDVIRANHRGPFLISGPAGSGKTTLAFHRIAYLLQSPDTAHLFTQSNVVTFVQDERTRAYFSQLLPELGIHDVTVTTFATWAFELLGIADGQYVQRPNGVDVGIDVYEFKKLSALRKFLNTPIADRTVKPFSFLRSVYEKQFDKFDQVRFDEQEKGAIFDRYDLTILLAIKQKIGGLVRKEEYFEQKKNFEIRRRTQIVPVSYALVVIDEVQNYLPEQIALLRSCVGEETSSALYVGDLAQQVLLGTVRSWDEAGEALAPDRRVMLDKVYRSTKQIMKYLRDLGYSVDIPDSLREGAEVSEFTAQSNDDEVRWLSEQIESDPKDAHIGVLAFSEAAFGHLREHFADNPRVHFLTVHQAQGVEFECVYLVGVDERIFQKTSDLPNDLAVARTKIQRDLIYVGLTRAMDKLTIIGRSSMRECLKAL